MTQNLDNVAPVGIELGETIDLIRHLTERKKVLEKQFRPVVEGAGQVTFGNYSFKVEMMPGRKTLDKKAMEEAGIAVDDYMKQGAPFTKMTCLNIGKAEVD